MTKILPTKLKGTIKVPASKSYSHRYLIGSMLANGKSKIDNLLICDDVITTQKAIKILQKYLNSNNDFSDQQDIEDVMVDCHESGTTIRMMLPLFLLVNKHFKFVGQGKLLERGFDSLQQALVNQNILFNYVKGEYIEIQGPLKGGIYKINCQATSQFLSGLLMALPLLEENSQIEISGPIASYHYVTMTLKVLADFGIIISGELSENGQYKRFLIPGKQQYQPLKTTIESDFSSAAFWLVAQAIGADIKLAGINLHSMQPDAAILQLLHDCGGISQTKQGLLSLTVSKLKPFKFDLFNSPDLGPILVVLACFIQGDSYLSSISRLFNKESNRLLAMCDGLDQVGVKYTIIGDGIIIHGTGEILSPPVVLKSFGDHRVAMALAILGINSQNGVIIDDVDCIKKSYPDFLTDLHKLSNNGLNKLC